MRAGITLAAFVLAPPPGLADEADGVEALGGLAAATTLRMEGGLALSAMSGERSDLNRENQAMASAGWTGSGVASAGLEHGWTGAIALSRNLGDHWTALGGLDGVRTTTTGAFQGTGAISAQSVARHVQFAAAGLEAGAERLILGSGDSFSASLGLRGGVYTLTGASEDGTESGSIRFYTWSRKYSAYAPGAQAAVRWAVRATDNLAVYLLTGYRQLRFGKYHFQWTDSGGGVVTGTSMTAAGSNRVIDFSGPEIRIGFTYGDRDAAGRAEPEAALPSAPETAKPAAATEPVTTSLETAGDTYQEAMRLYHAADYTGAWAAADRVIAMEPEHWQAWQLVGNCQYATGDKAGALVSYRRSLALHPANAPLQAFVDQLSRPPGSAE